MVNNLKGKVICVLIKTKLVYKSLFSIMAVLSNFNWKLKKTLCHTQK